MRLRELHLDRFGLFTDRRFDFGTAGDGPDFHIIHGPNEAGKTTTMEAVLRLFYGFPHRDSYAFKHRRSNLSISGVLEIDGTAHHFTRLPKRGASLLDAAGNALPETAIAAHLGGLSETDYRNLLCLDDDTIERGGEEIAQARGDIGRLLFSAAAGVADLSTVLEGVRQEADTLWRKRASRTRIAELRRDLAEVESDIRAQDVSAAAWRGLKAALAEAQAAEHDARRVRDALHRAAAEVAAQRRALPLLADIDRLEAQVAARPDYPQRLDFDAEGLVALLAEEHKARADADRLSEEIAAMTAERDGIARAPQLCDLGEALDALEDLRSRDVTAGLDLDRRRERLAEAEAAMARAAADLGVAQGTDPRALVLSAAAIARLEAARDTMRTAQDMAAAEAREVADLTERRDRARAEHAARKAEAPPSHGVGEILARHDVDRLAPAVAGARQALDSAGEALRAALDALSAGGRRFDDLPPCPTTEAQARDLAATHADLTRKIAQTEEVLARHRADAAARAAQAAQLTAGDTLIPDARAAALQAERDRLWQAHLAALTAATARPFETAMQHLDAAMRERLAQAGDLGQLRQIDMAHAEARARAEEAAESLAALRERQAALAAEVNGAAAAAGLPTPLAPADWHEWVRLHRAATQAAQRLARARDTHGPVLDRAATVRDALLPHVALAAPDFDAALSAARDLAATDRQHREAAAAAHATLAALEDQLARRIAARDSLCAAAKDADGAWHETVAALLNGSVAPQTLRASLGPLRDLREHEAMRAEAARRIARMQADQAQFADAVAALATARALPQAATAAETFGLLRERARAASAAETRAADLAARISGARAALRQRRGRLDEIAGQVRAMGRIFPQTPPIADIDALRRATAAAQETIAARAARDSQETALLSVLSVPDLDTARRMLAGATSAALDARADTLRADTETAEQQLTQATEARAAAEQALSQVTGDAGIARLSERRATLELQMEEAALDHLELSLGHRLAEEAIRRYRDAHRSAMMTATERSFAALTRGAYTRLTSQPDGHGETLLAVDAQGSAKRVAEMSKGTRFQLYLALRAAAHEQLVAQGTCLPFFCDDIFETFDEARTSAACRVMERIGRSGQAIYLTHHRHVVDIAQAVCDTPPTLHRI